MAGEPGAPVADRAVAAFAADYGFDLDDFQAEGITALVEGRSTLVAAPTGAGKTVVGEFAVALALQQGRKCFYTTPIKALSNQKFNDLAGRHGGERVGLLTGDNAINGDAPVVVMTTEVLRNMLYEDSSTLQGLGAVVLDEVHYLADVERGAVWEEVIIQLPLDVQLACLSATVSNAEEFGAWLRSVRDSCDVVISERRPVPLEHHYAVNERIYPVFRPDGRRSDGQRQKGGGAGSPKRSRTPNPEVLMLERRATRGGRVTRGGYRDRDTRLRPPRRSALVAELRARKWLPAIYFLFSRAGCDAAVAQLMHDGVSLTAAEERARIREVIDERTADLPADDLDLLGFGPWAAALERGVAAHHAGMVPIFKETVEQLFVANLVKVCFATETLALGINMPARTVVIERLEKWDGQRHTMLTPGQFTQLTGRAGRRGLDRFGHAVILYQRDLDFPTVASLVSRRIDPLRSRFSPSYNMAVNLLRRHSRADAERLLARSFAQFQADATVSGDEDRIERNRTAVAGYERNLGSDVGDFDEYWALRRELSHLESAGAAERRRRRADAVTNALGDLREGDVVAVPRGRDGSDLVAIVGRSETRSGAPLASAVTEDRRLVRIGPRELDRPPVRVGRVQLPRRGGPRQSAWRKQVAAAVRDLEAGSSPPSAPAVESDEATAAAVAELRQAVREHPVHHDPALPEIEVWARRRDELLADTEKLERKVRRRTGSLVREFDRIVGVLTELGYLADVGGDPRPTALGLTLAGIYAETDLVLTEALRHRALDGLDAADLAAVASLFVHETRMKEPPPAHFPNRRVADTADAVETIWRQVAAREEAAGLPTTRAPDAGFVDLVWLWAHGADLDDTLGGTEMTPGDFVRSVKQVADLLRQLRDAAEEPVASTAHDASRAIVRGVVAYSGL